MLNAVAAPDAADDEDIHVADKAGEERRLGVGQPSRVGRLVLQLADRRTGRPDAALLELVLQPRHQVSGVLQVVLGQPAAHPGQGTTGESTP